MSVNRLVFLLAVIGPDINYLQAIFVPVCVLFSFQLFFWAVSSTPLPPGCVMRIGLSVLFITNQRNKQVTCSNISEERCRLYAKSTALTKENIGPCSSGLCSLMWMLIDANCFFDCHHSCSSKDKMCYDVHWSWTTNLSIDYECSCY